MPPAINPQRVVAFIWDFDKTLTHGYMQNPLFDRFGVDSKRFWDEVNALVDHYEQRGLLVSKDTAYLGHMLTYAQPGMPFEGLTNELLRELGAKVQLAPGMPEFMQRTREVVKSEQRYIQNRIEVEHYIVSTGLRQMIEGNPIRQHVDGVWACELLSDPPGPGYLDDDGGRNALTGLLTQVGYVIDNTTKTRAIFEINKGANVDKIDVNAQMPEEDRRVPLQNMIYIADGPSDVPVFSVVGKGGGKTMGVHTPDGKNYDEVARLQDEGRVGNIAEAVYAPGSAADRWLMRALRKIADDICERRDTLVEGITAPAGHVV